MGHLYCASTNLHVLVKAAVATKIFVKSICLGVELQQLNPKPLAHATAGASIIMLIMQAADFV